MLNLCLLVMACAAFAAGQPVACSGSEHCAIGFFCEAHNCRECIKCEDLNRQSPPSRTSCAKSVVECGDCIKGMVDDRRGEWGVGCTAPDPTEPQSQSTWYFYAVAVVVGTVIVIALIIGIIKMKWDSCIGVKLRASILARFDNNIRRNVANPSAPDPDLPPTYPSLPPYSVYTPLMKTDIPSDRPMGNENAGRQEASEYNDPNYVRRHNRPERDPEEGRVRRPPSPALEDETTAPDGWRPGPDSPPPPPPPAYEDYPMEHVDGAVGIEASGDDAVADSIATNPATAVLSLPLPQLVGNELVAEPPPPKIARLSRPDDTGDSNNNRNSDSTTNMLNTQVFLNLNFNVNSSNQQQNNSFYESSEKRL